MKVSMKLIVMSIIFFTALSQAEDYKFKRCDFLMQLMVKNHKNCNQEYTDGYYEIAEFDCKRVQRNIKEFMDADCTSYYGKDAGAMKIELKHLLININEIVKSLKVPTSK